MTVIYPESTPVLGNIKVKVCVAVANMAAPKLATEINAVTSVDLSCAFTADGWKPTVTQNKGTKKRRLCSKSDAEQLNPALHAIDTLMYSAGDPQSPESTIVTLLADGAKLYFIERLGEDAEDVPLAVGDKVRTHYLELGEPYPMYDPTDDNAEFLTGQNAVYVTRGAVDGVIAT